MSGFERYHGISRIALALVLAAGLAGCGSIMHGTTQQISISSAPTGAQVTVDGMNRGATPLIVDLKRKDTHMVRVETDGFQPYEMALTRSVSGWVAGNLVFGGIVGLAVDAITGGMYKLSPEQVQATLASADAEAVDHDQLYIMVVLRPDPAWQPIGQLELDR